MSRAFVKEADGEQAGDDTPEIPQSPHPNYITPRGLEQLTSRVRDLQSRRDDLTQQPHELGNTLALQQIARQLRYLDGRIERAIVTDPSHNAPKRVGFGATVEFEDETGAARSVTIVGEDEMDVPNGRVSWVSPIAEALLGAEIGDVVTWKRPSGDSTLEITGLRYE